MEVGAVKQAFNNELIKLKKNLNQAKTQIIHKLTRKAKTISEKKGPQHLQEKLKRKSESAINEVLIIKKTKVKDLAHFMLTHKGDLNSHLNKPKVDTEKACARLLLHKSLNDRYKFIRDRFASVPIDDLLMSRQERQKQKKEEKEKKNKKKGKKEVKSNELDITGFEIESDLSDIGSDNKDNDSITGQSIDIANGDFEGNQVLRLSDKDSGNEDNAGSDIGHIELDEQNEDENSIIDMETKISQFDNLSSAENQSQPDTLDIKKTLSVSIDNRPTRQLNAVKRKAKDNNKNKNLNEKLISRKFKKDDCITTFENKVVDPFFKTETGENYLSVAEPRQPDEVKEVHKQGNRRNRRAAMFGHAIKYKPKRDNFKSNDSNANNTFGRNRGDISSQNKMSKPKFQSQTKDSWKNYEDVNVEPKVEKLHPSWEAKKKQSSSLPFQGKKIVFDDS